MRALVIGNGESRSWFRSPRWVAMDDVITWGCNAIYRDGPHYVDNLVAMDYAMQQEIYDSCLLYTSPSPRDPKISRMPSSA